MAPSMAGLDPQVSFYARRVSAHGDPVLVLGSGDGRLVLRLAATGARVVGIDPSKEMVREAQARRQGLFADQVSFVQADLATVRLPERFGVVVAPPGALRALASRADLERFGLNVVRLLRPGGVLACEVDVAAATTRAAFRPHLTERPSGGARATPRRLSERTLAYDDLREVLDTVGLGTLETYAGYDEGPIGPSDERRIVIASQG